MRILLIVAGLSCLLSCSSTTHQIDQYTEDIRLNQLGYFPVGSKQFVQVGRFDDQSFEIVDVNSGKSVFEGTFSEVKNWELAGELARVGDFSSFNQEGSYVIYIPSIGYSYPFDIDKNIYQEVFSASVKSYYYQRAGASLKKEHAGQWSRALGHPDDSVIFHPSSGRTGITASAGGWYDAGDYGKYVVNGAVSLGQMLNLYEQYPEVLPDNSLNIPESGNGISDFLDEMKYEMDWLLSMQDDDGGMFFKLTTRRFEGMVMPDKAVQPRHVIGKSTAASLDFAAVAAKFSRIIKPVDSGYAQTLIEASLRAWDWAIENDHVAYKNPDDVQTGEYGDKDFSKEFYWAATELYLSTNDEQYQTYVLENPQDFSFKPGESWANFMHYLAVFSMINNHDHWNDPIKSELLKTADSLLEAMQESAYHIPVNDYQWGSNSDVLNTAMILSYAFEMTKDSRYYLACQSIVDYVFGKNALGYSFVTGYGDKTPMYIHHRPSSADGIAEPVPGFISGGPNYAMQDAFQVEYPENVPPMKAWVDVEPSFASNEVCLNWNAPLVYMLGFLPQYQPLIL